MNFLKQIFLTLARRLGLDLVEQIEEVNDFFDVKGLSMTNTLSERLATATLMGSKPVVEGESARGELIQKCATELWELHMKDACTFALGTGSVLIKPNTNGDKFGFDIIPEQNYRIVKYIGNYIYSVLIAVGEYKQNYHTYTLIESQEIKTDNSGVKYIDVNYTAFRDGGQVSLSETRWSERKGFRIANVDRLLFGRMKCPTTNRKDVNSPNGVPILYGNREVSEYCKDSYRQYNQERDDKKTMIFADRSLFKKDKKTGEAILPEGKERIFMNVQGRSVDSTLIDTYSPEIREPALDSNIERNFRMLELVTGLGEGILSKSTATYQNMDEIRAMKQATFAFMTALRKQIDNAFENVLYAIDIIANYNSVTPQGEYDARIEWSDEYMTSVSERFNQMMQAESAGWVEAAEGRSVLMNEDIDEAREAVEEIRNGAMERMEKAMLKQAGKGEEDDETGGEE